MSNEFDESAGQSATGLQPDSPTDELGTSGAALVVPAELTQSQSSDPRVVAQRVSQRVPDAPSTLDERAARDSSDPWSAILLDSPSDASTATASGRRADGKFGPSNTFSLKHGGRRSLDRPEALIAIAGKRAELTAHLGDAVSVVQQDIVTDYARTDVLIESVAANIEVGGIFTAKGRTRAAVTLLLSLMDRRLRLATTLGIEKKQREVNPLDAVRAAVAEANRQDADTGDDAS